MEAHKLNAHIVIKLGTVLTYAQNQEHLFSLICILILIKKIRILIEAQKRHVIIVEVKIIWQKNAIEQNKFVDLVKAKVINLRTVRTEIENQDQEAEA